MTSYQFFQDGRRVILDHPRSAVVGLSLVFRFRLDWTEDSRWSALALLRLMGLGLMTFQSLDCSSVKTRPRYL